MIYCISDLHLGDKGPRDNFYARGEERFYRFLDFVADNGGTLIVAGDLLDFWQVNIGSCLLAYRKLMDRLDEVRAVLIFGNHDSAFIPLIDSDLMPRHRLLIRASRPFEFVIGNKSFAVCHGSEFDPTCASLTPGLGEITAIMSGMLEDRNQGPVVGKVAIEDNFISSLEAPLNLWRHLTLATGRDQEMLDNAEKYRIEKEADCLIYGHTHTQGRFGGCYNCGCWCRGRDGFVRINDGVVTMWTWDEDRAEPFNEGL